MRDEAREIVDARIGDPDGAEDQKKPSAAERMMRLLEENYTARPHPQARPGRGRGGRDRAAPQRRRTGSSS